MEQPIPRRSAIRMSVIMFCPPLAFGFAAGLLSLPITGPAWHEVFLPLCMLVVLAAGFAAVMLAIADLHRGPSEISTGVTAHSHSIRAAVFAIDIVGAAGFFGWGLLIVSTLSESKNPLHLPPAMNSDSVWVILGLGIPFTWVALGSLFRLWCARGYQAQRRAAIGLAGLILLVTTVTLVS